MGKIHDAYGGMDVEVTKSVVLNVHCGADHCKEAPRRGGPAACFVSQESWCDSYSPEAFALPGGNCDSPKWLDGEKLTKPRFYRHLLSIGWTLVERWDEDYDQNDWVWICPACSKGGE